MSDFESRSSGLVGGVGQSDMHPVGSASLDALLLGDYTPPVSEVQSKVHILTLEPLEETCGFLLDESPSLSLDPFLEESSFSGTSPAQEPLGASPAAPSPGTAAPQASSPFPPVFPGTATLATPIRRLESVASASVDHNDFISAARALASDVKRRRREKRTRDRNACSNFAVEEPSKAADGIPPHQEDAARVADARENSGDTSIPEEMEAHCSKRRRVMHENTIPAGRPIDDECALECGATVVASNDGANAEANAEATSDHGEPPERLSLKGSDRSTRRTTAGEKTQSKLVENDSDSQHDPEWRESSTRKPARESAGDTPGMEVRHRTKIRKEGDGTRTSSTKSSRSDGCGLKRTERRKCASRIQETNRSQMASPKRINRAAKSKAGPTSLKGQERKTSLSRKRQIEAQVVHHDNHLDQRDPSELTLWELVLRNKRIVTKEELEAKRQAAAAKAAKETEEAKASAAGANDDFADLFNDNNGEDRISASFNTAGRDETQTDLFGSADPLMSSRGGALRLDVDGNLLLEDSTSYNPSNADGLNSLFDGQQTVTENYQDMQLVKPFAGAYKVTKGIRWPEEDEEKFFKAISIFGLDLMMVKSLLPTYTYRQIRDKYRLEEKKGNGRVDKALKEKIVITTETFEVLHGPIDETTHYREFGDTDSDTSGEGQRRQRKAITLGENTTPNRAIKSGIGSLFEDEVVDDDDLFGSLQPRDAPPSSSSFNPDSLASFLGL